MASPIVKVSVLADIDQFRKAMASAEKQAASFGDKMSRMGSTLSRSLTLPLVALGTVAVKAAVEQEKSLAKLTSVFESMGAASWTSVDALTAQSAALQQLTTFGDEAIQVGQSLLLTFGNIKGAEFDRATKAMLDMSMAMDQGLKESAIQLGKALNDPIAGLAALGRVGIQFTDEQKNMIKSMVAANDVIGAQQIILAELERQFGGTAEAVAATAGGKMQQAMNNLGDAMEVIGAELLPVLADVADKVGAVAIAFGELPGPVKTATVELLLFAAVLGPVMKLVGSLAKGIAALKALGLGWTGLTGGLAGLGKLGPAAAGGVSVLGVAGATAGVSATSRTGQAQTESDISRALRGLETSLTLTPRAQRDFFALEHVVTETAEAFSDLSWETNETARFFRILKDPTKSSADAMADFKLQLAETGRVMQDNYSHFFSFNGILWEIAAGAQEAISQMRQAAVIAAEVAEWQEPTPGDRRPSGGITPAERAALEAERARRQREQYVVTSGGL